LTETGYYTIMIKMREQAQAQINGFNEKVKA
jgi:hypothetical protein